MQKTKIRIGTRASKLALAQANSIKKALEEGYGQGLEVELVEISTKGDQVQDRAIQDLGSRGVFVREVEAALLDGRADLAVHSLKDLPSLIHPDLVLVDPPKGQVPFDVVVARRGHLAYKDLEGLRLGTGSNRRKAQLAHWLEDVEAVPIRGSIETRMEKIETEGLDGVILALAGLVRGGYENRASLVLDPRKFIPSPCQGILGLEIRRDREDIRSLLRPLADRKTALRMRVERAFQRTLEASCSSPLGIYIRFRGPRLDIHACYAPEPGLPLAYGRRQARRELADQAAIDLALDLKGEF